VRNLPSFSTLLKFQPSGFEIAARYPNAETNLLCRNDRLMPSPCLVKFGPRTPENLWAEMPPTHKIARRKRAKSSISQPWIIRFRSSFV